MSDLPPRLDEWTARWIEPPLAEGGRDIQRPAVHPAGEFRVDAPVRAR